jgi:hypothetical protein
MQEWEIEEKVCIERHADCLPMFVEKDEDVGAISSGVTNINTCLIKPNPQEEKLHTWGLGLHVSFETFGAEGRWRPFIICKE